MDTAWLKAQTILEAVVVIQLFIMIWMARKPR